MMMKTVLVLLAALVLLEAKSTQRHCSKIRGRQCSEDSECACLNRHNSTLICNYNYTCEKRSFIDDIMRSQPCHRIYKSFCLVNADCPCSEGRLICEDNECVKERKSRPKLKMNNLLTNIMTNQPCPGVFKRFCLKNSDCPCSEARLRCEDNECVKERPRINKLLMDIMTNQPCPGVFKSSCSTNADCPCSEVRLICEDNECVKRPKPPIFRLLKRKRSSLRSNLIPSHKLLKTAGRLNK
ncbi:hypothetical protein ACROYT_G010792 [Oculina patagonica]